MQELFQKKHNNAKLNWRGFVSGVLVTLIFVAIFSTISRIARLNYKLSLEDKEHITKKIEEVLSYIDTFYVNDIDEEDMVDGIYKGLVKGVNDPYTAYFNKEDLEVFTEQTEGSYAGIGVIVQTDSEDKLLTVAAVFEGSPAEESGMQIGDKIVKVNDEDIISLSSDVIISKIKGKINTKVKLTVLRSGKAIDMSVERRKIDMPTVSHKMIDDKIGYMRIVSFDYVTEDQFHDALEDLQKSNMKAFILDLRNNPGGLLDTVIDIADTLLPEGLIMYTEDKYENRVTYKSDKASLGIPMIVLVNENSASASEVLAGAIKAHKAGELLGTTTFGKGVVQRVFSLKDYTAIKITVSKYFTPDNVCIQGIGIEPNHVVELPEELQGKMIIPEEEDIQLQKAIEILKSK